MKKFTTSIYDKISKIVPMIILHSTYFGVKLYTSASFVDDSVILTYGRSESTLSFVPFQIWGWTWTDL